jgi:hypothetical protein
MRKRSEARQRSMASEEAARRFVFRRGDPEFGHQRIEQFRLLDRFQQIGADPQLSHLWTSPGRSPDVSIMMMVLPRFLSARMLSAN